MKKINHPYENMIDTPKKACCFCPELNARIAKLENENKALRAAAMPFVKAREAFGEVRMSRDDTYLWTQNSGRKVVDVKISLTDCDRLKEAVR